MKKALSLVLSALMLTGILAACSSESSSSSQVSTPAGGESSAAQTGTGDKSDAITITVTRWGDVTEVNAEQMIVDKFNEERDDIQIVYDVVPGDGYGDRLTTSFSSGEGYDIFASGEGDFYKWVSTGLAAPMDDLMAADGDWTNDFNKSILDMGNIEGHQYYIVRDYNPIVLWYNKDVFDNNDIDYPTNDWDWDDLLDAAEKLTVKNDDGSYESFGFNAQSWAYASLTYMQSNGIEIISPDGETVDGYINSPEMAAALEEYVGFSQGDDRISPNNADMDAFGSASAMLINGSLAMTLDGGWALSGLEDSGVNYGTAIVPGNHDSYLCASAYAISTRCENPEAAWEVIKALTGPECTELRVEYNAALPTIDSQLEVLKSSLGEKNMGLIDQLDFSVQPVGARFALGNYAVTAYETAFERVVYNDGDTQDILDEAAEEAMKEYNS